MKRSNKKRLLKGLPLMYKKVFHENKSCPAVFYHCGEIDNKVVNFNGKIASQKDILTFKEYFLKFSKEKKFSIKMSTAMAKNYVNLNGGITIEQYKNNKRNNKKVG